MPALAQCDAFAYIYDQAGDPAPDILVVLKRVLDASGNPILLGPKTTVTDSAGSFHFTLPEFATAFISARASALWNCPDGRAFKVPLGPSGELVPDFSLPPSTLVEPPLVYVGDVLSIPKASETQDGYLSAADYVAFLAGAGEMGITQIDTGAGLTGGPITDTGTISLAPISGVAGTWSNPTSVTINAYGQIIAITATADTTAPVITLIATPTITGSGVTITWHTDDPSDSQVEYGLTTSYGTSTTLATTPVVDHVVTISGLSPSTPYHYRVKSRNTASLLTTSGDNTFTTTVASDTTPPVISAISATSITDTGATIIWTTDDFSDSQVEYGLTTSYGSTTTIDSAMVTSHSVPITGTTATTLYHYRVKSKNAGLLTTTSTDHTFTTTAIPDTTAPVITLAGIPVTAITNTTATINWTTNEASDSQVEYGPTTAYANGTTAAIDPAPPGTTTHAVALTGLTSNTTYHYRAHSKDAAGNPATPSADAVFTTSASTLLTGLVSFWKLEESSGLRVDSMGNSDMTLVATLTAPAGKIGNCNVSTDHSGGLQCADNTHQDFSAATGITIAGWINLSSVTAATGADPKAGNFFPALLGKWSTPNLDFLVLYNSGSAGFQFSLSSDGTSQTDCTKVAAPDLGNWHFVCATWDGTTMGISVDGGTPTTHSFTGPIHHGTAAMEMFIFDGASQADCKIDEVGLWNRALTPTEIADLYHSGAGLSYPFA